MAQKWKAEFISTGVEPKMASPVALLSPCRFSFFPTPRRVGFAIAARSRLGWSSMSQASSDSAAAEDVIVQYVVLRRDLIDAWPLGSVVTQGCHASVAAIWSHRDDPLTLQYCSPDNLDSMHKVTLEVKGEPQMLNLAEKLKAGDIAHKLWIEQPENIPTCLATKPYPKSVISSYFKKLKLCK
ncbi:uncharacterized protein LOC115692690 [Syzygium oleosum]|uniref:uncharacterized protein LOC115692690 n=1 Tax=Syzygium oleosum TaxID=219896 RepID=UPI0024BB60DD|nr:uncharacterized protein LOC115692690 [Syzygium oleosum]